MNPVWLARNMRLCWRNTAGTANFFRELGWLYAHKLPGADASKPWTIAFHYPKPVGDITLALRSNRGADAFIHGEVFHHHYYDLPLAKAPNTILDLGANIGLTATWFGRVYPAAQIACVEPMPSNLDLLRRNLYANGIRASIFDAAIDVADGEVRMAVHARDYGHQVAAAEHPGGTSVVCKSVSVPTVMRQMEWSRIGLLKVDIEGHEKILFSRDCDWLQFVDAMCVECHDGFYGPEDLSQLAARFGFETPEQLPGIWLLRRTASTSTEPAPRISL